MFTVAAKCSGNKYLVYCVRDTDAKIEFLVYRGKWIWAGADNFEPLDSRPLMNEIEQKYNAW